MEIPKIKKEFDTSEIESDAEFELNNEMQSFVKAIADSFRKVDESLNKSIIVGLRYFGYRGWNNDIKAIKKFIRKNKIKIEVDNSDPYVGKTFVKKGSLTWVTEFKHIWKPGEDVEVVVDSHFEKEEE